MTKGKAWPWFAFGEGGMRTVGFYVMAGGRRGTSGTILLLLLTLGTDL